MYFTPGTVGLKGHVNLAVEQKDPGIIFSHSKK